MTETKITDDGIAHLATLHGLSEFQLQGSEITTEGLFHFRGMPGLKRLDLANSPNLTSLEPLRPLVHLTILNFSGSRRITDPGVAVLSAFPDLRSLSLSNTGISDEALESLKDSKKLEGLRLWGTNVSDKGLTWLAELKSLKFLTISQTHVTAEAYKKFQATHPSVSVYFQ